MLFTCMAFIYGIFSVFGTFRRWYRPDTNKSGVIIAYEEMLWTGHYYTIVVAVIAMGHSVTKAVSVGVIRKLFNGR